MKFCNYRLSTYLRTLHLGDAKNIYGVDKGTGKYVWMAGYMDGWMGQQTYGWVNGWIIINLVSLTDS